MKPGHDHTITAENLIRLRILIQKRRFKPSAVLSARPHLGNNLSYARPIFFLGIVFVQNAKFAIFESNASKKMMGIKALFAIRRIVDMRALEHKIAIVESNAAHDLIAVAKRLLTGKRNITAMRNIDRICDIHAVARLGNIKTLQAIFRIHNIIAGNRFGTGLMHKYARITSLQRLKLLNDLLSLNGFQGFQTFKIFFGGVLTIENTIFFMHEPHATEQVHAGVAIVTVCAILTIAAILTKIAVVTFQTINRHIAKIAIVAVTAVQALDTVITPIVVEGILQKIAAGTQIRISAPETIVAKIRINTLVIHNPNPRRALTESLKFIEKPHDKTSYNKSDKTQTRFPKNGST